MKHWAMGMTVLGVVLAGTMVGCESDRPPEETTEYDPAVDPEPTNLLFRADPDLLRDQGMLAVEAAQAATTGGKRSTRGTGTGREGENANVAAVREILGKLIDAGKGGQHSAVLQYLAEADGQAMKEPIAALVELSAAAADFNKAVRDTLGMKEPPASIKQALEKGPDGGPVLASLGDLATDMLSYNLDGNSVTVGGGGTPLRFLKNAAGNWEIHLTAEEKAMYAALGELAGAQKRFVKTLADGIREGAVTESNIDEKAMALMGELITPPMEKLKEAIEAAKQAAGTGTEPGAGADTEGSDAAGTP